MPNAEPQAEVFHPEYGTGTIVTYRRGGRVAIVDFDSQPMPTHVPTREFTLRESEDDDQPPDRDAAALLEGGPVFEGTRNRTESARVLEAMRLGVVPASSIDAYTVGRDVEVGQVQADLGKARGDDGGAVRAFLGDYGTGKTHLLQLASDRVLDENFLSARVVLDPRETPPSHPKRVYRQLVQSLRYPDRPYDDLGLRPLFERAVADDEVREQFDVRRGKGDRDARLADGMHLYLSPALSYFRELTAEDARDRVEDVDDPEAYIEESLELLFDWIEGHPTISNTDLNDHLSHVEGAYPWLYSLMDFRPWARIYGYLLSGLSTLARAVGYEGLAVFIDEAERFALLSSENRDYARYVFKAISYAAVGRDGVPFARSELAELGGWGVQQDLPPRYGDCPGLYAIFAMTPYEQGIDTLYDAVPAGKISELRPFDDRDYAELAHKVCDFYASAHPDWEMTEETVTRFTSLLEDCRSRGHIRNPRDAMKFLVELLDIARHRPDALGRAVDDVDHLTTFG